jgi:hypothetical protein
MVETSGMWGVMPGPMPLDLRLPIVRAVERGSWIGAAAHRFGDHAPRMRSEQPLAAFSTPTR